MCKKTKEQSTAREFPVNGSIDKGAETCIDHDVRWIEKCTLELGAGTQLTVSKVASLDSAKLQLSGKNAKVVLGIQSKIVQTHVTLMAGASLELKHISTLNLKRYGNNNFLPKVSLSKNSRFFVGKRSYVYISQKFELEEGSIFSFDPNGQKDTGLHLKFSVSSAVIKQNSKLEMWIHGTADKTFNMGDIVIIEFDILIEKNRECKITLKPTTNPILHSDKSNTDMVCSTKSAMGLRSFFSPSLLFVFAVAFVMNL
jgi:hypothetical protein